MKVVRSKKKGGGINFYSTVYNLLKQEKTLNEIKKKLNISKQNLNYYLRRLEKEKKIRKISQGYYKVKISLEHPLPLKKKEVRGHAFIWTVKLDKKYNWKERLEKRKIKYKLIRGIIPRIIINNRKIWFGKKTITIYEPHSFYGTTAPESRKYAVISLIELLGALELKLEVNLSQCGFKPAREHYGIIKNDLAIQCNRNGEKIHIRDEMGEEWLWIDDSEGLGELETGGKKAMGNNLGVQGWWNDTKKHKFKVTPSFILESFDKIRENLELSQKNLLELKQDNMGLKQSLSQRKDISDVNPPGYIQ